jgi:[ribosomal protein S18]-alanine N-acetyltransferase
MILGIDASSKEGGLAISKEEFYPLEWVEDIPLKLKELDIDISDVEKILITHGPGSFTSLRIGLVTAQGLSLPGNIPILAYSTFLAMIKNAPNGDLIPLIPARNKVVYSAFYKKKDNNLEEIFTDKIFKIEDLAIYLNTNFKKIKPTIFGKGAEINRSFLENKGFSIYSFSDIPLACNLFSLYEDKTACVKNPSAPLYIADSAAIRKRTEAEIVIREMKEEDLKEILKIEKDVFPNPWPYEFFLPHILSKTCIKVVAVLSGTIVGYMIGCEENSSFHLSNIAISKDYWRKGFGTKLLSFLLGELSKKPHIKSCYLEHRTNNEGAFELYKSLGFTFKELKKDYYKEGEDAVVMEIKC